MDESTTDQIKGKFHEMKGDLKKTVGKAINDPELTAEGKDEKLDGRIQKKVGEIKKVFGK